LKVVVLPSTDPAVVKAAPSWERSMVKPVAVAELLFQLKSISLADAAVAVSVSGAASGVVKVS